MFINFLEWVPLGTAGVSDYTRNKLDFSYRTILGRFSLFIGGGGVGGPTESLFEGSILVAFWATAACGAGLAFGSVLYCRDCPKWDDYWPRGSI